MPRLYRGRDIQWWLAAGGILDQRHDEVDDIDRARRLPSPQLVGSPERRTLDLNALSSKACASSAASSASATAGCSSRARLRNVCALADLKLNRLLDRIDAWCAERRSGDVVGSARAYPARRRSKHRRGSPST